ncbi:DUF2589 domain-containing protein [bacterium]|nr:DUF2589 domain-containing protein [candidate division CSSED10-310 bacterium]
MSSIEHDLSSIDFESMLGGPLTAVVNAQAQAAISSVNFIKSVGFKLPRVTQAPDAQSVGEPIYVTFHYPKEISPYQPAVEGRPAKDGKPEIVPSPSIPAVYETQQLSVPILTMLPIPFIRIEETTIDFNAKINSIEYKKTDSSIEADSSLEAGTGWLWGSAKLKVSASYKKSTSSGSNVDRTYSLAVHMKAVQDEMPAGIEKILSILENNITSQPVKKF